MISLYQIVPYRQSSVFHNSLVLKVDSEVLLSMEPLAGTNRMIIWNDVEPYKILSTNINNYYNR